MTLTYTFLENETNVMKSFGFIVVNVGSVFLSPGKTVKPLFYSVRKRTIGLLNNYGIDNFDNNVNE